MGVREWRKVATEVKERWTAGAIASRAPEGSEHDYDHCALGAIGYITIDEQFHQDKPYEDLRINSTARSMVKELALELMDTVPDRTFEHALGYTKAVMREQIERNPYRADSYYQEVVLRCNDHRAGQSRIAKAVDNIVGRYEAKLSKRKEAAARRKAEKEALLVKKELKVEYQPTTIRVEEKVSEKA